MEAALGTANGLLGKVLNKLSDDLVKAYMSSTELGLNLNMIKQKMLYTRGLLEEAERRDIAGNPSLQGLLEMLGEKADEAEDTLDELHYFMIQDKLDGTRDATPELGDGLCAKARHAHHAARHTAAWSRERCDCHCSETKENAALNGALQPLPQGFCNCRALLSLPIHCECYGYLCRLKTSYHCPRRASLIHCECYRYLIVVPRFMRNGRN